MSLRLGRYSWRMDTPESKRREEGLVEDSDSSGDEVCLLLSSLQTESMQLASRTLKNTHYIMIRKCGSLL